MTSNDTSLPGDEDVRKASAAGTDKSDGDTIRSPQLRRQREGEKTQSGQESEDTEFYAPPEELEEERKLQKEREEAESVVSECPGF